MTTHSMSRALAPLALALSVGCAAESPAPRIAHAAPGFDRAALEQLPRIDRLVFDRDGFPGYVRGNLGLATRPVETVADARDALHDAADRVAATLRLSAADFEVARVSADVIGMTHVRYQQTLNGLPVVGGEMILHVTGDGVVESVTNAARPVRNAPLTPDFDASAAQNLAIAGTLDGKARAHSAELVYIADELAWRVRVSGTDALVVDDVFVSATSGAILARHPQVHTALDRVVRDAKGENQFTLISPDGTGISTDHLETLASETMAPQDPIAKGAFENTGGMWQCYNELFGRDSYDGLGGTLESVVHITFFDIRTFSNTPNNAAWLLGFMLYGDGDGQLFSPLAEAYDVTAHELTHGVVQNTANLVYSNESGALNEGMADIMAAVCEAWNDGGVVNDDTWFIGEDVWTPNEPGDALRYMNDPVADGPFNEETPDLISSRDHYDDRYTGSGDNGGVHINSGIANLAFSLLVTGGTHPRGKSDVQVASMDIYKAGEIFLSALENYMTANTNFAQARVATEEAALALYGEAEVTKLGLAWAAVGVGEAPEADSNPPTVAITSPDDGAAVTPGFAIDVAASDDIGIASVELLIDGALVGELAAPPFVFTAPETLGNGEHTVQAIASDGFNETSTEIAVTLSGADDGGDDDGGDDDTGNDDGGTDDTGNDDGGTDSTGTGNDDGGDGDESGGCSVGSDGRGASSGAFLLLGIALLGRRRRR